MTPEEESRQDQTGLDDDAQREIDKLEDDPPKDLNDWPDGKAKYETFGGPEGEHSYEEGPEAKLGPSGLVHKDDGSVEIDGEPVDNPEDYKGEPIDIASQVARPDSGEG